MNLLPPVFTILNALIIYGVDDVNLLNSTTPAQIIEE